jgi:hypothetical protein
MERLRTPFFIMAMAAMGLVVLAEIGATWIIGGTVSTTALAGEAADLGVQVPGGGAVEQPVGLAIRYLVLIDVIALITVGLMGVGLLVPDRLHGKLQSIVTLIASILIVTTAIVLAIVAFVLLILMVTLLLAFPFGTIAYLIIWGSFPRGQAVAILSLLMFLKLVFAGTLVAAQPRFIQNKGLVALVLTSLVANLIVAFLHALVPGVFVSILDAVAAIVVAIIAIIWAIVLLVGSILGLITAIRATAASALDVADVAKAVPAAGAPSFTPAHPD